MLVCDDSRDGYRVPACRSSQMNPATASFLPPTDPERPPEPSGTREAALAPSGRRDALGRGRIQPASLGNRTRGTRGSPSPACTAPSRSPSLLFFGFWCIPSPASRCPAPRVQPAVPRLLPSLPSWSGLGQGQPQLASSLAAGSPGGSARGPHPSGSSSGRGGQQRGAGAGRGLAHPCPPRLWSLQRQ